jgi:hypothetical protein
MKKYYLLILIGFFLLLISCKKDSDQFETCKAGVVNDDMYYYNNNSNKITNHDSIDLNRDGTYDIKFWIFNEDSPGGWDYRSAIYFIDSAFQLIITSDSKSPLILNFNDTIDINALWSEIESPGSTFHFAYSHGLTFGDRYDYGYWLGQTGYIGIRNEYRAGKYKYGWIKIHVESYCVVFLEEYSYKK